MQIRSKEHLYLNLYFDVCSFHNMNAPTFLSVNVFRDTSIVVYFIVVDVI